MLNIVNELFSEIGGRIGIDGLSLDDNRQIMLDLESDLHLIIEWREDTETLLLSSELTEHPCDDPETMARLLKTNSILTMGHGLHFNLNEATGRACLAQVISVADRSSFTLQDKLDTFIRASGLWQQNLRHGQVSEATTSSEDMLSAGLRV